MSNLKDGDFAGLSLLQKKYGLLGVRVEGTKRFLVMINKGSGDEVVEQLIPLTQNTIYLKASCDFREKKDVACFYYSLGGSKWMRIGTPLKMSYTLPHFMGYRFGLFNFATKKTGGFADFDFFRINNNLAD